MGRRVVGVVGIALSGGLLLAGSWVVRPLPPLSPPSAARGPTTPPRVVRATADAASSSELPLTIGLTGGPVTTSDATTSPSTGPDDAVVTAGRPASERPVLVATPTSATGGNIVDRSFDEDRALAAPPAELPPVEPAADEGTVEPAAAPRGPGRSGGVPILMYHYIRVNPVASDRAGFLLSVTPADFAAQARFLAEHGFTTVTMAQVRAYVRDGTPLPKKPVALTFDDGYDDAYTVARPILEQEREVATFYVVTGFLERRHYLTWSQVLALDREGMEIGSHTVHHASLPTLGGMLRQFELVASREALEAHLGHPVLDFCYPGGQLDAATELAVRQTGYLSATTTASGRATRGDDPFRLPRLRISGGLTLRGFAALLGEPFTARDLALVSPSESRSAALRPSAVVAPTPSPAVVSAGVARRLR